MPCAQSPLNETTIFIMNVSIMSKCRLRFNDVNLLDHQNDMQCKRFESMFSVKFVSFIAYIMVQRVSERQRHTFKRMICINDLDLVAFSPSLSCDYGPRSDISFCSFVWPFAFWRLSKCAHKYSSRLAYVSLIYMKLCIIFPLLITILTILKLECLINFNNLSPSQHIQYRKYAVLYLLYIFVCLAFARSFSFSFSLLDDVELNEIQEIDFNY